MSMNISPHIPQVVVNAAAPSTEALAKANAVKEVVPAAVQSEAIVPQKTREQEARGGVNNSSSDTYEGIQNSSVDNKIIPEDEEQNASDQEPQEEQEQAQQNNEETDADDEQQRQEKQQQAEQNKQEAAEQEVITQLQLRDREVRAHEQAHAAIGGSYAGAPSYEFQTGPDGRKYAVGGEVSIDVSKASEPEQTISKMQTVRAAALAPAEPSAQDRKVAAQASQNIADARAEMISENSSLTASDEVKSKLAVNVENQEANETSSSDELAVEQQQTTQTEQPSKMNLAQQFISNDNTNKTAQVISQKYASSADLKEHFFNAVA